MCLRASPLMAQQVAGKYCITGRLKDSLGQQTLKDVEIRHGKLTWFLTDSTGFFRLCSNTPIDTLVLSHPYYRSRTIVLRRTNDSISFLGDIFLGPDQTVMMGVNVRVKKEKEKIEVDKKTYVVSGSVLSTGGTALDALRQIPAVNVDADGTVSIRGSSQVTIYINGKQSSLSGTDRLALLMQIPAANIESIDVNTNPGAKQDAEGMSGIINIALKQNTARGRNGYITAGAGNRNKYNATASLNYNNKIWNFANTVSFRQNDIIGRGLNERHNFSRDTSYDIDQYSNFKTFTRNFTWSGSVDYHASKTLVLSGNYMVSYNQDHDDETSTSRLSDFRDSLSQLIRRRTLQRGNTLNTDMGIGLKKTFDQPTHQLLASLNYSRTRRSYLSDITQDELSTLTEVPRSAQPYLLYNDNRNYFANTVLQLDYTKPFSKTTKLETGLKFTGRNLDNDYRIDSLSYVPMERVADSSRSNHFIYSENVSALYGVYAHTVNDLFKYSVGVRFENTSIFGGEVYSQKEFTRNYSNLFPSGNLNLALQKKYNLPDMQLSYSRRISRPGQWQLNPFISISDPYNVSKGNPLLKPELTDAVELSAYYQAKIMLVTATVYFRQTNAPISRYRLLDSGGISVTSFYNLDYNRSTGAELVSRLSVTKNLKLILNGNLYSYLITGNVAGNDFITQRLVYSGKANLNYTFWKKAELQASFAYMGPMQLPQGKMKSMYGLDIGFKKDIVKDKWSFSLNLSDAFNNRRFAMLLVDEAFTGAFYRKRESRILTCNLTWKFGNANNQENKKPRMQEAPASMDF
jgi:iron complex outermembrane receptor protein